MSQYNDDLLGKLAARREQCFDRIGDGVLELRALHGATSEEVLAKVREMLGDEERPAAESCDDRPVIVRPQRSEDYEAAKHIYGEAFRRPEEPDSVPLEVPLFEALWEAGDVLPEFSFTAETDSGAVGHVTASRATVATHAVVAVGPIGVLPEHQGLGIGSALMDALLTAADAAHVPLVVLLGSPRYYSRFGFRPAEELGVVSPEPKWGDAFQARPLTAYTSVVAGPFQYAPAFPT